MTQQIQILERIIFDLEKILGVGAHYNPMLKIIAYDKKNQTVNNSSYKKILEYVCKESKEDNDKLNELNNQSRYLAILPRIRRFFMETFWGYKRI